MPDDPIWAHFMRAAVWIAIQIGVGLGALFQKVTFGLFRASAVRYDLAKPDRGQLQKLDTTRRVAECQTILQFYADNFGYIARECISREELNHKVDRGISPEKLNEEIQQRMEAHPGMILGYHPSYNVYVKLPPTWRTRHIYIVGRSGSGKTNIIKV